MSASADAMYRVQISGPGFSVTQEANLDERSFDAFDHASLVLTGALASAANELPRPTRLLADAVAVVVPREACGVREIRAAEDDFVAAAERLLAAWFEYDQSRKSK